MIEAFYEKAGSYAIKVATFETEGAYFACVQALEAHAASLGYILTERTIGEDKE